MNKNEFFEAVKDGVLENLKKTDDTLEATISKVTKLNNIVYTGLSFKSQTTRVAPVVYLDEFFARFSDDDLSLNDVIVQVSEIYKTHSADSQDIDVGCITDYNAIKDKIVPAICNAERCTDYLKDAPHEQFCNLAIYFRIIVDIRDGEGSVLVSNQLMNSWNIGLDDIKSQAWENLKRDNPPSFKTMYDVLKESVPAFADVALPEETDDSCCMHVLTNHSKTAGAVYMADTSVLEGIAGEMDSDLIILPSSRHEVIVLPIAMAETPDKLADIKSMVTEINHNGTVSDEDFLGDSVYVYHREAGTVEIAA